MVEAELCCGAFHCVDFDVLQYCIARLGLGTVEAVSRLRS